MKYPFYLVSTATVQQAIEMVKNIRLRHSDIWLHVPKFDIPEREKRLSGRQCYRHQLIGDFTEEEIFRLTGSIKNMKQDIMCITCRDESKKRYGDSLEPYPGEYLKYVNGRAIGQYKCDHCGKKINPLEQCCAYSVSTKNAPYFPWEHKYIIVKKEGIS